MPAKWSILALAISWALASHTLVAQAQELEPRSYSNTPVGLNFLLAGYSYTTGNIAFSPTLPITDARVTTHSATFAYIRSIDVLGLSGKIGAVLPYAALSGDASFAGDPVAREIQDFADPKFRLSLNFLGAPALTLEEYRAYEQDLIIGATVEISPPLGQYDSSKLVNLGTNRWSVKTELGASQVAGPVTLEGIAAVTFFTSNDDFLDGQSLEQEPLYSARGHVIRQFAPWIWGSLDATYYWGGATSVDGSRGDALGSARLGLTTSLTLSKNFSMKLFGSTGVYSQGGSEFDTIGLAGQWRWGAGL